jgi:hypothetical protein
VSVFLRLAGSKDFRGIPFRNHSTGATASKKSQKQWLCLTVVFYQEIAREGKGNSLARFDLTEFSTGAHGSLTEGAKHRVWRKSPGLLCESSSKNRYSLAKFCVSPLKKRKYSPGIANSRLARFEPIRERKID